MQNVGTWDRFLRIVIAIILMVVGSLYVDGWIRLALYVVALILVFTATTGFCLLYKAFGITTKK